ncbi:MAG TPA: D-hexose-6-phosphate mutarotase [Terracidiphilus sp.]|nr:D-hexose-6-phosphate mutarotase [Terracidiphilus sp.]
MSVLPVFEQSLQTAGIKQINSTELYPALHAAGDAGLPMLVVDNDLGRAVIALQGAHVMSFKPAGHREMLWVSPKCVLEAGKPIRAGIPLCVPWFGPSDDGTVMHGFGRTMVWTPVAAEACADGSTRAVLELASDAAVSALWRHAFSFRLEFVVGTSLKLTLTAENRSATPAPFAFAFHTYFSVPNVKDALVTGLEDITFIDKTEPMTRKVQRGGVAITALTDRVYLDVSATQVLKTATGNVSILSDSKCAVVWNAWTNDINMADLGEGNHVGYLCVERGDVADYAITLPPGGEYQTVMTLSY